MTVFNPVGDKSFLLDPAAELDDMRRNSPVYRHENSTVPIVNVFSYEDVRNVLRDVDSFSNALSGDQQDKASTDPHNLLGMDPPRHKQMRDVVSRVFTPKIVKSLTPTIREHADDLTDHVLQMGEFDAVEDFGASLAVHLICQLIGVPEEDEPQMRAWTIEASELGFDLLWHKESNADYESRIEKSMSDMHDYFEEKIAFRLKHPGDDVLTKIAQSGLTRAECVSFARLLLVAGNETTTNLINHTIRLLITHPDQMNILRANPSLATNTIAETLRFAPSLRSTFRESKINTRIRDVEVNAGEVIWAWLFSANRDPALCNRPQEFLIERKPPNHLAFGHGIHTCLGISLAKMEALVTLETMLSRTSKIEAASEHLVPIDSLLSNGYVHQPVRFTAV